MKGSKFYWYRWSQAGRRYAISLKTESLDEAIKQAKEIKSGQVTPVWEQGLPDNLATKLVDEYVSKAQARAKKPLRPRTAAKREYALKRILRDMGVTNISQITPQSIQEWLRSLEKKGNGKDTQRTYAMILRTFLGYLVKSKAIFPGVLKGFDLPQGEASGRKNWVKAKDVARVISESKDPELTFILLCGFHAGLRRNEIANAKVGWFDLEAGLLHVQNDPESGFILKDRENRSIQLTNEFKAFLPGFLEGKDAKEYALRATKKPGQTRDYRCDFRGLVYNHFKRLGVTCTIHDMRRSFASNQASSGQSIYIVAKWLGDGVQVVERSYGHLSPSAGDINKPW